MQQQDSIMYEHSSSANNRMEVHIVMKDHNKDAIGNSINLVVRLWIVIIHFMILKYSSVV